MWNDVEYGRSQVHIVRAGAAVLYTSGIQLLGSFFYWVTREQIRCSEYEVQTLFLEIKLVIGLVSC